MLKKVGLGLVVVVAVLLVVIATRPASFHVDKRAEDAARQTAAAAATKTP